MRRDALLVAVLAVLAVGIGHATGDGDRPAQTAASPSAPGAARAADCACTGALIERRAAAGAARPRARPEVLRQLPQRSAEDRRPVAAGRRPVGRRPRRPAVGEGAGEAARRHDAAAGDAAARRRHARRPSSRRSKRALDRQARGRRDPGPQAATPPESHRVRQRDPRPAGSRTSTRRACCRPTTRATASTTSPACCASRRRCSSSISAAARKVSSLAVGTDKDVIRLGFRVPPDDSQEDQVDSLPLGTRGGLVVHPHLPAGRRVRVQRVPAAQHRRLHDRPRVRAPARDLDRRRARVHRAGGRRAGQPRRRTRTCPRPPT